MFGKYNFARNVLGADGKKNYVEQWCWRHPYRNWLGTANKGFASAGDTTRICANTNYYRRQWLTYTRMHLNISIRKALMAHNSVDWLMTCKTFATYWAHWRTMYWTEIKSASFWLIIQTTWSDGRLLCHIPRSSENLHQDDWHSFQVHGISPRRQLGKSLT